MRILFINQYYAPDFAATAQILSDLCVAMSRAGHEVHVLCSKSIYDGRRIDLPAEELLDGVRVHRIGIAQERRTRYRERLQGYVSFLSRSFARLHSLPRFDVVVTLTTPPFVSLLGVWSRWFRGARFLYWVMDIYPDIALQAGVLRKFGPTRLLWDSLGRIGTCGANSVVVLSGCMRSAMRRKGVPDRKLAVLPCWSGGEEVRPVQHAANPFRRAHFRGSDFVVMYSGNAGTCHHFQSVIDAVRSERCPEDVRFAFIGGGKRFPQLQSELSGSTRATFLPYQPRELLSQSLSAADVHLVTLEPAYDGLLFPSKVYGAMAVGRPIVFVGSGNNEIAQLLREAECGVVVPPGDADALCGALGRLARDPDACAAMGARGIAHFAARFERDLVVERFRAHLESLAAGAAAPATLAGVQGER